MVDFLDPKDIQKLLNAEDSAIENFVSKLKNKIERQLNSAVNSINKQNNLDNIIAELSKLSVTNFPDDIKKELSKYITLYTNAVRQVKESIQQVNDITEVYTTEDNKIINQLFDLSRTRLITSIDQTYNEFKTVAYQNVISNNLPDLKTVVTTVSDNLEARLPSDINTQLAGFQRAVTLKKSDDLDLTHFLYSGGLIKTSRPFCQERAGKIFTFAEAKTWDNGQGLPAIPYLGGYNCRHAIVPMTKEKAISLGYAN